MLIVYQSFHLPKVKQGAIIGNKHGIYELCHELPNNIRLRTSGNYIKPSLSYSLVRSLTS